MPKSFLPTIVATFCFAASAIAIDARADDGVGVGKWRWNAAESHYTTGNYATEQTMEITRNDKKGIAVSQVVTPIDGKTFSWSIEAPYDDKMRHASTWMSFAFKRISDNSFHDRYVMNDGKRGEETFTISPQKLVIKGNYFHGGKKLPYVEVWDRVE